ncbi:hypothetical protein BI317_24775 (plasmid) [Xanthomonas hortorum pv. gardneri]|uniref:conjugal transfer protein TraF n=1 Tax=Xanthomonas hortorum TaxID=56454 RepID=UPI0009383CEE|nr:conjugal transfer protein TraF [Xanthomonas hortorum]APP87279.1 hypothetical protein BI317_24775 [Xanthomonas hortorum pv. gardneri]
MTNARSHPRRRKRQHGWASCLLSLALLADLQQAYAQSAPDPKAVFDQALNRPVGQGAGVAPAGPQRTQLQTQSAPTAHTTAPPSATKNQFLSRHEDGWFWYVEPPAPPPKKPIEPPKSAGTPTESRDKPLSVEWIRNNIDRLRDQAINNPTKENVEMFLYVHKYMMDLSERFAYTYRSVAEQNTALDETISNPVTAVSRRQISDATEGAQSEIIQRLAGQVGVWYFFQSTCQYCLRQNPILDYMRQEVPLSILPISLDGLPMVDGSHPNWVVDSGQAAQLQVSTTPTLYLVKPDTNEVVLLAAGLRSLPELKQRFVEVARAQNWISKDEYETAMHGLPRRLLTDGVDLEEVPTGTSDRDLLDIMRRGGIHGGGEQINTQSEGGNTPWRNR